MSVVPIGESPMSDRPRWVRRGRWLNGATIAYNSLEGVLAIGAGLLAGSVALVGFGVDSAIELAAGLVALWRLASDVDPARRERAERVAHRLIGFSFLGLAVYVLWESGRALWFRDAPDESVTGIVLAAASLLIMPVLARAKRTVARHLGSRALESEATQTSMCMWLSAILLAGLTLNAVFGWWWADPAAALGMVPILAREGVEGLRGRDPCGTDCGCSV
jgi:divalent metal cation (Fe/Co/Zn/Cd) transporter